jgi:hypothetical protein
MILIFYDYSPSKSSHKVKKQVKLSNESFLRQTLALQTRQLQLKRQKLRLETRKVQALESIASLLNTFQALYSVVHGISIESYNEQ